MNVLNPSPLIGLSQRMPPHNSQAEQALLGALLANNRAIDRCLFLRPEHFADPIHGRIYQSIVRRLDAGQLADAITLKAEFEHSGILDEAGGTGYLASLLTAMVGIINAGEYAAAIHDAWTRRELIEIGETIVNNGFGVDPELTGTQVALDAQRQLDALTGGVSTSLKRIGTSGAVERAAAAYRGDVGQGRLDTGLPSLDALWLGLWPGDLYYLMARSRTGKTQAAAQIARAIAARLALDAEASGAAPEHVHFLSLEMTAEALDTTSLASTTRWTSGEIRAGQIGDGNAWNELDEARLRLAGLPIVIDDDGDMTISSIGARVRAVKRSHRTRLVIVDYLEMIDRDREYARMGPLEWYPHVGNKLKRIAKACGVPVLALRQLNKGRDSAESQRPTLGDLPFDGGQAADSVFYLWRPELTMGDAPPTNVGGGSAEKQAARNAAWHGERDKVRGVSEFGVVKHRFGPAPAWRRLKFDGPRMLLREVEVASDEVPDLWGDER